MFQNQPLQIISRKVLNIEPIEGGVYGVKLDGDYDFMLEDPHRVPSVGEYLAIMFYGLADSGEYRGYGCWGLVVDEYEERFFSNRTTPHTGQTLSN